MHHRHPGPPDGSQALVGEEHRLSDPAAVATLTAALRRPDAPPYQGICSAVGYLEPLLFLLDAGGHWLRPALPVDPCGAPQSAAGVAVGALARRPAAPWPIRQIVSAGAARSGCSEQWKDMVHVDTSVSGVARAAESTADPFARARAVRACAYRVPASEVGRDGSDGTFERGAVLSGARRSRLGTLLATGRSAGGCTTDATRFEVLQPVGGPGPTVYVELDGCRRVLTETVVGSREVARLARSSPALLDLLAARG